MSTTFTAYEDRVAANELRAEIRAALSRALAAITPDAREISVHIDGNTARIGTGSVRFGRGSPKIWVASLQSFVYATPRLLDTIAREAGVVSV